MDFVAASLMKARFWVILCPIDFMKRVRDSVSEMVRRCRLQPVFGGTKTNSSFGVYGVLHPQCVML